MLFNFDLVKDRILAHPYFKANGERATIDSIIPNETIFFPGSFNPPHQGHFLGAKTAIKSIHRSTYPHAIDHDKLIFSTTINPLHKTTLTPAEILNRIWMMRGHNFLLTENDPLYLDKIIKFPGAYFIIGADAFDQMLNPKWLDIHPENLLKQINKISNWKSKLLVLSRLVKNKLLICSDVLEKYQISGKSTLNCIFPVHFNMDISSTKLRNK